jgi:hypothetical protein
MVKLTDENLKARVEVYQLRYWLKGVSPMIWRRLLVRSDSTIADLHFFIQLSLGWSDDHLHQFSIHGKDYGITHDGGVDFSDNPRKIKLSDFHFRLNEKWIYEYNFHVPWTFEIRLEKCLPLNSNITYPQCLAGHWRAPPEDCGGAWRFMELQDYYSYWKVESLLLKRVKRYRARKIDIKQLQKTIIRLEYWAKRSRFNRRKVNHLLQGYARGEDVDDLLSSEENVP